MTTPSRQRTNGRGTGRLSAAGCIADITLMMAPAGDNQNGAQSLAEFLTGSIATAGSE